MTKPYARYIPDRCETVETGADLRRLIYVVGPPGSGKSTLMAGLTRGLVRVPVADHGMPRDLLFHNGHQVAVELGRRRGTFSGTDALGMAVHPTACRWLSRSPDLTVLGEGQRLGTRGFLRAATDAGRLVDLLWLDPPEELCAERRAARGSQQSPAWIKAATTRAAKLASSVSDLPGVRVVRLSGEGSPAEVEQQAVHALNERLVGQ